MRWRATNTRIVCAAAGYSCIRAQRRSAIRAFAMAASAWSATLTYPGAAPCNTTLQACITGAAGGDVVEIATNTPVDEDLTINKSLTLRPAAGYSPTIGAGASIRSVNFDDLGLPGDFQTLVVEGLNFNQARIDALKLVFGVPDKRHHADEQQFA